MGVKAGSNRRSLRGRVAKKQERPKKPVTSSKEGILVRFLRLLHQSSRRRKFYAFGYLFHFSPLDILGNETVVLASFRKRAVFYGLSILYAAMVCYRVHALIGYLIQNGLDLTGVLSSMYVLLLFTGVSFYDSVLFAQEDIQPLLNLTNPQCKRQSCGLEDGAFSTLNFWLQRTCVTGIITSAIFDASIFSLFFDSLPVCVYPNVKGFIPDWGVPAFAWQVVLFPVEILSLAPPFLPVLISLVTILVGLARLNGYMEGLRKMTVLNYEDWHAVEREYRCALVYNQILNVWFKRVAAPAVIAAMFGLIGIGYVALTSFERLPFIIYVIYPTAFVATMGIFTLACMDAVNTKTRGDNVLSSLRARTGFFMSLDRDKKKELLLRGRALRPSSLPIGNFTDISLNVPVYVFEEVINQILFFLSF